MSDNRETDLRNNEGNTDASADRPKMSVEIAGIRMKNPVMTASGTFGFGREYSRYYDLGRLGALVTKGLTLEPKRGNPQPRIAETPAGMLNAIGLQNPGLSAFVKEEMPFLRGLGIPVIVNMAGNTVEEYGELAARLSEVDGISGLEVNISCPNVKEGGIAFGVDPASAFKVVRRVRENTPLPVIVKLSPNVTDIVAMAKAAEDGGADAISLINTLLGMAVDIRRRKPLLGNVVGGLSGPAVKPVALRMVYQVRKATGLPIIGMGGITCWEDAVEFIMAGANAVAVGTGNFINPVAPVDIIEGIERFLIEEGVEDINRLSGVIL